MAVVAQIWRPWFSGKTTGCGPVVPSPILGGRPNSNRREDLLPVESPSKTSWPSGQATDCNSVNVSSTLTEVSMMARSQAAKAPGFGPGIRGFESSRAIQPFVGV